MADETVTIPEDDYVSERVRIAQRFIALGGGASIDMDLARMPKLADLVTDQHRAMVKDLVASGLSQDATARIMGISKERLQTLFEYEVGTGYEIAQASMARSLYVSGLAGNSKAASDWLRYHNRSQWSEKSQLSEEGAKQEGEAAEAAAAKSELFIAGLLAAISVDPTLYKKPGTKDNSTPEKPAIIAPKKTTKLVVKKPKGD